MTRGVQQRKKGGGEGRREDGGGGGRRGTLGKTCGTDSDGVSRGEDGVGGYLADRGVDPEREKGVQGHWVGGGDGGCEPSI